MDPKYGLLTLSDSLKKHKVWFFKNILGVHGKSSSTAVRCELGIFPLCIESYGLMYGYYTRLNSNDEQVGGPHSILKAAYEVDILLTIKENWWANSVL